MTCKQECHPTACVENQFFVNSSNTPSEGTSSSEETKTCTGCEESAPATSYCMECTEWLCDQCVQAHRRVRITKDHSILPKDSVPSSDTAGAPEHYSHCPTHKTELLKLFCETCERLTCRDCQLQNHKDHRYSYINEASTHYKQFLTTLVGKLKEKQTYVENAKVSCSFLSPCPGKFIIVNIKVCLHFPSFPKTEMVLVLEVEILPHVISY